MTFLLLLCFAFIFCLYCYYKDEGFFLFTTGDFLLRKYGDAKLLITNDKKFRINRLGFTEERLEELNKSINRNKEIGSLRNKSKAKIINRNL